MQVVDVHRAQPEVGEALLQLVRKERRPKRVSASYEVVGRENSRREQRFIQPRLIGLARRRRRSIQGHVAALGAHEQFVAAHLARRDRFHDRMTHRPFRALAPVVAGGIDDVDAATDCRSHAGVVARILFVRAIAKVRSAAECADQELARKGAEVVLTARGRALREPEGSRGGRPGGALARFEILR